MASSTKEEVGEVIENLKAHGIENILALRGDIPEGMTFPDGDRFHYAYELVQEIKKHGDFCIAQHVIRKDMWSRNIKRMISVI